MGRSRRRKLSREPFDIEVTDLSHDGRGVGHRDGKAVFIHGALAGERVSCRLTGRKRHYDEAETIEVYEASSLRIEPRCPHFGVCGGCSLQHLDADAQIEFKHQTLVENFRRIGEVEPSKWFTPLRGPNWHYRRKARLSARYVHKKEKVLVGFRERYGRFVADMNECHVLDSRVADHIPQLSELIASLEAYRSIPQIEVACGDDHAALIVRHLEPLCENDIEGIRAFARSSDIAIFLQPKGPDSITLLEPEDFQLSYRLPSENLELQFSPSDFIQVNSQMNWLMIDRAIELLQLSKSDHVLDLFCGLGNFSLPMARHAGDVVGVEGDASLVQKASRNAELNAIENARFYLADLTLDPGQAPWMRRSYDKCLIDPPRSGAAEILPYVSKSGAGRLVYVSCHPGSLARDAGILVRDYGFRLTGAGVMDMFPHTAHVESIAVFEREMPPKGSLH